MPAHPPRGARPVLQVELPARPRKRPRQPRSIMLVDALKEAGRTLLETEGREALVVNRLSELSGVAVSSIYEYFPTIESLIAAIYDDYRSESRQEVLDHLKTLPDGATLFDGLLSMLQLGTVAMQRWAAIDPEAHLKATYHAELVRLNLVESDQFWSAIVMPMLMERFSAEVRVRDREKAGFLAYQLLLAVPRAMALARPEYVGQPDTPLLFARMLHALLTTDDQAGAEGPAANPK